MNILMVTPTFLPKIGGIENYILSLSKHLRKKGDYVEILLIDHGKRFQQFKVDKFVINKIPARGKKPFLFFRNINNYINLRKFNLIHIHDPQLAGISFHFYIHRYGLPMVLSTHGGFFHTKKKILLKKVYWHFVAAKLIKQYKTVIAISPLDFERFRKITNKTVYIPNGIECNKFNQIFEKWGKNNKFIYFGRFSENKGIINLLKVFSTIWDKGTQLELTLVGKTENKKIKELISYYQNKYKKVLNVKPFLNEKELIEEISKNCYYINATKYEGFGISIMEALVSGRIGIINRISPLTELLDDKNVFFIDFPNINQASKEILYIFNLSEECLEKRRKKINVFIMKHYDWNMIIDEIKKVYKLCFEEKDIGVTAYGRH